MPDDSEDPEAMERAAGLTETVAVVLTAAPEESLTSAPKE
jgi:hypothetical protein